MSNFEHVKVGDWVHAVNKWGSSGEIIKVSRVTETLLIAGVGERRFLRSNGISKPYRYGKITGIATPGEVSAWQAQEEAQRERREAQVKAEDARLALRGELINLFVEPIYVDNSENSSIESRDGWAIQNLTEAQVRICAEALREKP